jgi:hypothetical protein
MNKYPKAKKRTTENIVENGAQRRKHRARSSV